MLFSLDGVSLDAVSGFDELLAAELPDSALVRLTLIVGGGRSERSGRRRCSAPRQSPFDVLLSPAGAIIGPCPADRGR